MANSGAYRALVGDVACPDGAFDGSQCQNGRASTVQSQYYLGCITAEGQSLCHEIYATSAYAVLGPGDSGGPAWDDSICLGCLAGVENAGMVQNLACPNNNWGNRQNTCSSEWFFVDLQTALSTAGLTLNV